MPKGKEITVSNVTDKEYYRLSQAAYHYKMLALHMKYKTPYKISKTSYWYVEKVKQDSDTDLDDFIFSKGIKTKSGKWVKSKNPENVVVAFAGTEIAKGPIFDCWNIVFGNDPKKEVYYKEKNKNGYSLSKRIYRLECLGPANNTYEAYATIAGKGTHVARGIEKWSTISEAIEGIIQKRRQCGVFINNRSLYLYILSFSQHL
ncbi:hypothetical protein [Bacillus sp. JFL15]|uniref:hypothetical protein n=1 Tax=Bacillus sp. JFL15 TaxID=1679193 RepID=UPI00066FC7C5|nr:hypothetical protein [Bacillus sp. JFL15]